MVWATILSPFVLLTLFIWSASAIEPTRVTKRDNIVNPKFVSTKSGQFSVNGSNFPFVGTNAYWLSALNSEDDLVAIFSNMSATGIKVVRTWGFNDVDVIPENGTWFQLIANGTTTINNGTNGFAKLDAVIQHAENFGLYVMVTLTNNWNPRPLFDNLTAGIDNLTSIVNPSVKRDVTPGTNNSLPRNYLSNDYGGMDTYVRQFGLTNHDDFYTNETLISAFENYTNHVVSRYVNSPAIFAWEIANDPRCNSSLSASAACNTTTITSWIHRISTHIKSIDANHLVSAGNQGFFCADCPKLFPRVVTPPPHQSPVPGARRNIGKRTTKASLLQERRELQKRIIAATPRNTSTGGIRIRGKWVSTKTRRQDADDVGVGPAFDGSQGVDSEDIMNIPQVGFGTFQLFPDQNTYGPDDPTLSPLNNTIQIGIDWIKRQAAVSQLFGKPLSLTGFGLVTQSNAPFFVPFNTTIAPFGPDQGSASVQPYGVTDPQRDDAYSRWLQAGIESGLQGIMQYQWSSSNLTAVEGTAISPSTNSTAISANTDETGISPNDGYSIQGQDQEEVQGVLKEASTQEVAPG